MKNGRNKIILIAVVCVLILSLFGCQLITEARAETAEYVQQNTVKEQEKELRWEDSFMSDDSSVKITISSSFTADENAEYSVINAEPHVFDKDEIKVFMNALCSSAAVDVSESAILSKEYIANKSASIDGEIKSLEETGAYTDGTQNSESAVDSIILSLETEKERLQSLYEDASLKAELKESDYEFDEDGQLMISADGYTLFGYEYVDYDNISCGLNIRKDGVVFKRQGNIVSDEETIPEDMQKTAFEMAAIATGKNLSLQKIKETEYEDSIANETKTAYIFCFSRILNDVPVTFLENGIGIMDGIDTEVYDEFVMPRPMEKITVTVSEDGVLDIHWWNPVDVLPENYGNAKLLPFSEIKETAERTLKERYTKDSLYITEDSDITIEDIKLGYMLVRSHDNKDRFMYVPVWDFIGRHDESTMYGSDKVSFLTINAVDGSIPDRRLNY